MGAVRGLEPACPSVGSLVVTKELQYNTGPFLPSAFPDVCDFRTVPTDRFRAACKPHDDDDEDGSYDVEWKGT